jgi:hypothetical protein
MPALLLLLFIAQITAFQVHLNSPFLVNRYPRFRDMLYMRDGSTAENYFSLGDKVRVVKDMWHYNNIGNGEKFSSIGMSGIVTDVWEKCDVDPHCCCAELVFDAPIEVTFNHSSKVSWSARFAIDEIQKL